MSSITLDEVRKSNEDIRRKTSIALLKVIKNVFQGEGGVLLDLMSDIHDHEFEGKNIERKHNLETFRMLNQNNFKSTLGKSNYKTILESLYPKCYVDVKKHCEHMSTKKKDRCENYQPAPIVSKLNWHEKTASNFLKHSSLRNVTKYIFENEKVVSKLHVSNEILIAFPLLDKWHTVPAWCYPTKNINNYIDELPLYNYNQQDMYLKTLVELGSDGENEMNQLESNIDSRLARDFLMNFDFEVRFCLNESHWGDLLIKESCNCAYEVPINSVYIYGCLWDREDQSAFFKNKQETVLGNQLQINSGSTLNFLHQENPEKRSAISKNLH